MKKTLTLLLALSLLLTLAACGASSASPTPAPSDAPAAASQAPVESPAPTEAPAAKDDLIVFAAASMTETLSAVKPLFEAAYPAYKVVYNFDSSGTLKTQIQEGADCDVFISAAQKQMNQLDIEAGAQNNPDGLDFLLPGSRTNLLENKVGLVVSEGNPKDVTSFDQLAALLESRQVLLAMGNSDVPVGQYTERILSFYGLPTEDLALAGVISYGSNVKEVTTQVKEASVDCGVVYCTDAFSAGLAVVDTATAEMCGQVIYPAAVLKNSHDVAAAQAYLDFLRTPEAEAIFTAVGFSPVK